MKPGNQKGIGFGHLNCRSLNSNDELTVLLEQSNLEFLMLTETWLSDNVTTSLIDIDGYSFVRLDRDVSVCKSRG